jgi:hypothetical protein
MKKVGAVLCLVACVVVYFLYSTKTIGNSTRVTHINDIIKGEKQK